MTQIAEIADTVPRFPRQLESVLSDTRINLLRETQWYRESPVEPSGYPLRFSDRMPSAVVVPELGLSFLPFGASSGVIEGSDRAARGGSFASFRSTAPFAIMDAEVTVGAYSRFVDANPQWAPDNRDELAATGRVDHDYLADWPGALSRPGLPVTGVSYYAAQAFADWVGSQYLPNTHPALPSESEWNALLASGPISDGVFAGDSDGPVDAASAGGTVSGVHGVAGNVWEWLEDWYGEYAMLYPAPPAGPAAQRVVRGGSWVTNRLTFDDMDRGSLPPDWCSPFVGFRLVIRY